MVNLEPTDLYAAAIGGIIIGLATTLNFATYGRITGMSGIFNSLIKISIKEGFKWKLWFLSGLITATYSLYYFTDKGKWKTDSFTVYFYDPIDIAIKDLSIIGWIMGGILVGVGTRMGNGWTSGHGVWGIPRLSKRSIVAVIIFMSWGIGMATFRHYVPFFTTTQSFGSKFEEVWPTIGGILAILLLLGFLALLVLSFINSETTEEKLEMPISWVVGFLFGIGLATSGMLRRSKINNFLTIYENWDPSLMLVMGGAVGVNIITFNLIIHKMKQPAWAKELALPKATDLDLKLMIGAGIFGFGWGLSSLCPGPGMVDFFVVTHCIVWIAALAIGQLAWDLAESELAKQVNTQYSKDASKTN